MIAIRPLDRDDAQQVVRALHSHHKPHRQQRLAIGCETGRDCGWEEER